MFDTLPSLAEAREQSRRDDREQAGESPAIPGEVRMSAPAPQPAPARTIQEVIARLDDIIARSIREQSRLGYFAALYRKVTIRVKEGIAEGRFENGPRMERLDVTFANRYLEALDQLRRAGPVQSSDFSLPSCWLVAFKAAAAWRPIILQQLLLGTNAHVNFDLGIAAAEIAPGDELPSLRHDFDEINNILASLVGQVESEIDKVSPWIKFLDHIDPKADVAIVNFSLDKARASAWDLATKLAPLSPSLWKPHLEIRDLEAAALAELIWHPVGLIFKLGLLLIRSRESNAVARVIEVLN
ncbi:MAG TPA: DUF5995 family protein [Blastocatellia bacterium]|nr:DUF5995 family protein [Blastocatellia bacterium]